MALFTNRYSLLIALLLAAMFTASWLARDKVDWHEARAWAAQRAQRWQAYGCPVLVGERETGCSRDDLADAAMLSARWPAALTERLQELAADDGQPRSATNDAELAELTQHTAAAVDALRRSTRRATDVATGQPTLGPAARPLSDVLQLTHLFHALRLHAQACKHTPADALPVLVDGLIAATDLAAAGIGLERLLGVLHLGHTARACDDALLRGLDARGLRHLADVCERTLDALPQAGDWAERELAQYIVWLDEAAEIDAADLGLSAWSLWGAGFSARRHGKQCLVEALRRWQRIEAPLRDPDAPFAERQRLLGALHGPTSRDARFLDHLGRVDLHDHLEVARTELQLLRLAATFHLGRPLPVARDPMGDGPLVVNRQGDAAQIGSAGNLQRRVSRRPR